MTTCFSLLGGVAAVVGLLTVAASAATDGAAIDRHALVARHNVVLKSVNARSPLTVGNGEFAFGVDVTGLHTFPDAYEKGIPLSTQSQWGWHSIPLPPVVDPTKIRYSEF